jgi:hypothetical protein
MMVRRHRRHPVHARLRPEKSEQVLLLLRTHVAAE